MERHQHDLVVIGAGPGGYVAAIRAAQLGLDVGCVEKDQALGGTCLRIGCIPSKALLESSELYHEAKSGLAQHGLKLGKVGLDLQAMLARKDETVKTLTRGVDGLLKKNKVKRYVGSGAIKGPRTVEVSGSGGPVELEGKNVLIATGSVSATLPGVELDGDAIGTSTEALSYDKVPKHLVVIGAGAIGLELGSVWGRLGAKVTVLEFLERILPGMDAEIAEAARKILVRQGLSIHLGARVTGARRKGRGCVVEVEGMEPVSCDRVLLAVGRAPNT
ncbi:MAG: NAD(P)/FAD-dependent oxidoreductase, partial [Acidobacteriota bacterium]|nr:NAD(P)/FAD-dependent oxidoreductase [Acidobacteriota bacterium]